MQDQVGGSSCRSSPLQRGPHVGIWFGDKRWEQHLVQAHLHVGAVQGQPLGQSRAAAKLSSTPGVHPRASSSTLAGRLPAPPCNLPHFCMSQMFAG